MFLDTSGGGPGSGQAIFPFPIPNLPWVAGIAFDAQWAVFDPGSVSPLGVATSRSGKLLMY